MKRYSVLGYLAVVILTLLVSSLISGNSSEQYEEAYAEGYHAGYEDGFEESEYYHTESGYEAGYEQAADDAESEFSNWYTNDFADFCYHYTGIRLFTHEEFYELPETRDFYYFAYRHGYDDALEGFPAECTQEEAYKGAPDIFYHFP